MKTKDGSILSTLDSLIESVNRMREESEKQRASLAGTVSSILLSIQAPAPAPAPVKKPFYINDVPFGNIFYRLKHNDPNVYMRLRPVSYLLNSTLVSESLANGKSMICNIVTGSCFFIEGSEEVSINVKKEEKEENEVVRK